MHRPSPPISRRSPTTGGTNGATREAVLFPDARSRLKVFPVNIQNHIRARSNQVFIASFERSSAKIRRIQVPLLQHGPHRAVKHEDSLREQLSQSSRRLVQLPHLLHCATPRQ